jgi:hypothetical protein
MATYTPLRLQTRAQVLTDLAQKLIFWTRILVVLTVVIVCLTVPLVMIETRKFYADYYQPHDNSDNQGGQKTNTAVRPNAKYP